MTENVSDVNSVMVCFYKCDIVCHISLCPLYIPINHLYNLGVSATSRSSFYYCYRLV